MHGFGVLLFLAGFALILLPAWRRLESGRIFFRFFAAGVLSIVFGLALLFK